MYARRLFAKALSETVKFWSIHRNWTFAAGPIGAIVVRGLHDGWRMTRNNLAGTLGVAALGFVIAWVGTFLINIIRASALLDRERDVEAGATNKRIVELSGLLEREQYNLSNSPQLILGFNQEFFIRNIGQVDGRDAKIHSMRVNDLLLYSDELSYIGAGDTVFNLHCRRTDRDKDGSPVFKILQTGVHAFQMFIEEIIRTSPMPDAIRNEEDPARRAAREYQYLMMNNHMLVLDLMYSDFAGHQYLSPGVIAWTMKDGGRIVEVRPQSIKKLTTAEAVALNAGENVRCVAGIDSHPESPRNLDESPVPYLQSSARRPLL